MKTSFFPWKTLLVRLIAFAVLVGLGTHAQAQQDPIEQRIEQILSQMDLNEKLDYVTGYGVDFTYQNLRGVFNIRPMPDLGLPLIHGVDWAPLQPPASLAGYDAVVLAVGGNEQWDGEAHDRSFRLPEFQDDLIVNATRLNPRTIVVLHGGGGFNMQAWVNRVGALIHAWFPGQYGGQPLAEILFGEVNPSGKLPITIEKARAR